MCGSRVEWGERALLEGSRRRESTQESMSGIGKRLLISSISALRFFLLCATHTHTQIHTAYTPETYIPTLTCVHTWHIHSVNVYKHTLETTHNISIYVHRTPEESKP